MVLPFLSAGLSLVSGVAGLFGSDDEEKAAKRANRQAKAAAIQAANAGNQTAAEVYALQKQMAAIEYDASKDAFKLARKAAGLGYEAADIDQAATLLDYQYNLLGTDLDADEAVRQYQENIRTARKNIVLEKQASRRARKSADANAKDFELQAQSARKGNVAAQAASGLQMSGSLLQVDDAIFGRIEGEISKIRYQGDVEMFDHILAANNLGDEVDRDLTKIDITNFARNINKQKINEEIDPALRAVTLSKQAAQLDEEAAYLARDTSKRVYDYQKEAAKVAYSSTKRTNNINKQGRIQTSNSNTQAAVSAAGQRGFDSLLTGATNAFSSISKTTWGQSLATKAGKFF